MTPNVAILFLTHEWNEIVRLRFERLRRDVGTFAKVYLLMQASPAACRARAAGGAVQRALVTFDAEHLPQKLGYPYAFSGLITPGSVHFAVLNFSRHAPHNHYFLIEYDVEFSGHWLDLFVEVLGAKPDFASHHFCTHAQKPSWPWWRFVPGKADIEWASTPSHLKRSFNPVFCLSHQGAELIHAAHLDGWRAHYEMLIPTLLSQRGCKIIDIGALTGFCKGEEQEPFAGMPASALSSFRWRPSVSANEFLVRTKGATLFHPVKDPWYFTGTKVVSVGSVGSEEINTPSQSLLSAQRRTASD